MSYTLSEQIFDRVDDDHDDDNDDDDEDEDDAVDENVSFAHQDIDQRCVPLVLRWRRCRFKQSREQSRFACQPLIERF